jgi:hypothetical protein
MAANHMFASAYDERASPRAPATSPTFHIDAMMFIRALLYAQQKSRPKSLQNCSGDFSANPLIALIATLDSAQVGLALKLCVC